jgi:adenosine deaminase
MIPSIPKAELHCHIEGAASAGLVMQQGERYGVDTSSFVDPARGYIWTDFTSFLDAYDRAAALFRSADDYTLLAEDHYLGLAAQNCLYAEVFASPDHAARIGCSYTELIEAIATGIRNANTRTGIEGRIIVVGLRHEGPERVEATARLVRDNPHPMVTGFGMAGDERVFRQADFQRAFRIAGEAGLGLTVHAGELCGAESVRDALDHLDVSRIGHGVRAIEDPELVRRLAAEGIVLETCPASNIALNVFSGYANHPFRRLEEAGCRVTLNSDDPPHFHSSLANEYRIAAEEFGYQVQDLERFTRIAIEAAFVDGDTRRRLLEKLGAPGLD